jgi:hypothetical protein
MRTISEIRESVEARLTIRRFIIRKTLGLAIFLIGLVLVPVRLLDRYLIDAQATLEQERKKQT